MSTAKNLQIEVQSRSKSKGYRFWIGCSILLLGLPLLYYGYCWGLWGRQSLLLQYLFQCNCPPASEEARYPEHVDVVVPACSYDLSRLSPSGRLLYIREKRDKITSTYLLDLQTNEKINFELPEGSNYFLNDDLLFLSLHFGGGEYILDRTTEKQYPLQRFIQFQPNAYSYGTLDREMLFEALLEVETVFLLDAPFQPVIALSSDFHSDPDHSFSFQASALSGDGTNLLRQFLEQNDLTYHEIPAMFLEEARSPDQRFVARADGIYLAETEQKIVDGYSATKSFRPYSRKFFRIQGWAYDSTAVIYSKFINPCLIEINFLIFDDYRCYFEVPQPLLKLKVPEEDLLPPEIP